MICVAGCVTSRVESIILHHHHSIRSRLLEQAESTITKAGNMIAHLAMDSMVMVQGTKKIQKVLDELTLRQGPKYLEVYAADCVNSGALSASMCIIVCVIVGFVTMCHIVTAVLC